MLSFFAFALVATCVFFLLTGRMSPLLTFSLFPVAFALGAGFSLTEVERFALTGIHKVVPIAVMFIFAILYFALMQEKGLFTPLINWVVARADDQYHRVTLATVLISILAHLDGSGSSTFLICIPALLPVYQRLRLNP